MFRLVGFNGSCPQLHSAPKVSTSGIKSADLVHSYFETTSQCLMMDTFKQHWATKFCTKLDRKGYLHAKRHRHWLVATSEQCAQLPISMHPHWVPGEAQCDNAATVTLQPCRYLLVPKVQDSTQKTPFWQHSDYPGSRDNSFKWGLQGDVPSLKESWEKCIDTHGKYFKDYQHFALISSINLFKEHTLWVFGSTLYLHQLWLVLLMLQRIIMKYIYSKCRSKTLLTLIQIVKRPP